ncbi:hypothetical protein HAX54_035309 [Datura stramonium]|uniref:Protein embryonic flower 1 n=1 Tax=Datura stramonium TaxID=4076 RepID=A0ABS8RLZ8_DATST|nr:hypothetical protein [Datura stramonium]
MRNKDMKICSPFGSSRKPEEQLPPLDVPKFKWWRCDKCLQEIGANHESVGDESDDAFVHTSSTTVVAHICSELEYMFDSQKGDKSKEIMDDAADTSDNEVISSRKRNKSICNVVGNKTVKAVNSLGDGTESQGVRIEEIGNLATKVIVPKKCSTREIETNSPVANLLNNGTNTEPIPSNDGQRTASDQMEVLGSKEKVLNTSNVKSHGLPSLGVRKATVTPKESDANLAKNSLCDLHKDIANDVPRRRRTPKVQLIADLLSGKDNLERSCTRTMPMVPSKPDTVAAPKDKVSLREDVGRGIKISQKKKNTSQEDVCRSGMNLYGNMAKTLKTFNENQKAERSSVEIEVTDSHLEENGSEREQHLQSGSKSVKVKYRSGKDSGVSRKKHKQAQVVSGYSIQMPLEGENSGLGTTGHHANILFQSSHISTNTGKVEHHLRNNDESLHEKERDSSLNRNSNKFLEVKHASSHMNVSPIKNLQRESLSNEKDVVQIPIGVGIVMTSQSEKGLPFKEKLDQSLRNIRNAQKHVEYDSFQRKSITNCPLTLQKDNMSCDPLRSNVFEPGQSLGQGVNSVVRQSNLFEIGQYSKQGVNLYVRPPNVAETDQYSREGVGPLVNVAEVDQYSRKGVNSLVNMTEIDQDSRKRLNPLVRQPNIVETTPHSRKGLNPLVRQPNVIKTGQYLQKGVQSQLRQTDLSKSGQPLRKTVTDLNQWQGIESSLNPLHWGNLQIQNPMETPCSSIKINLNEVQGYSYVTKPQQNQWPNTIMEKGPSDYVRPMGVVEMLNRNPHEGIHSQTQSNQRIETNENGVHAWLNPGSTTFHPVYANDVGGLRDSTPHLSNVKVNNAEIIQVREQLFRLFNSSTESQQKLSNRVQISAPVPTRWGLQHGKGSNLVWFPSTQSIFLGHDNLKNDVNQKNHKLILGQSSGSHQKRRTISDIKSSTVDLKSWNEWSQTSKKAVGKEHSNKAMGSFNPYSSGGMPEIQSLKLQERPFAPCNNHPPIHMDGKQSIFNGSFFPHHQLMKESSSVHMGGFTAVQSSQQYVPYFNDQVSLGQEKKRKLQQPTSSSGLLCTTSKEEPGRFIGGASSSKVVPLQDDNISKSLYVGGPIAALPISTIPKNDPPCLFNQNPADIVKVDDERYLRSVEDQRIRDKSSLRENLEL